MMKKILPITAVALLALAGCGTTTTPSPEASPEALNEQAKVFQQVCGVLPKTGKIASVRAAAIKQGFKPVGTDASMVFGFRNFEVLGNGAGLQVNLSNTPTPMDMTGRREICVVIGKDGGGSDASFKAAATAFATSQGVTSLGNRPYMSMDETGKLEYRTDTSIVRLDWQDRPYALVVYTVKK